jgi:uncharacterized protein YbaR (Trm112 family)
MTPSELADFVCPKSKQPLVYVEPGEEEPFLLCPASRLRYRIDDGIPVLLVDEAVEVSEAEVKRLLDLARQRR